MDIFRWLSGSLQQKQPARLLRETIIQDRNISAEICVDASDDADPAGVWQVAARADEVHTEFKTYDPCPGSPRRYLPVIYVNKTMRGLVADMAVNNPV